MSEAAIDDLLEEHVDPFEPRTDGWDDVLARARRTRRHYALLCVVLAALLLVPTGVALRGQIVNLFQGTHAPPGVSKSFEGQNKMADLATQKGFAGRFPHADVSKAHGVLEVQTGDGPEDLWVAPSDEGGQCWFIDFASDTPVSGDQYGFGGCDRLPPPTSNISWGAVWLEPHPTLLTLWGHVYVPANKVEVELADGSRITLPLVEGFFLGSLDKGVQVDRISAYDASGNSVASVSRPS
jgi:hypothetical protein